MPDVTIVRFCSFTT